MNQPSKRNIEIIQFFDIDGVLTDPTQKRINQTALTILSQDLESGKPIILETGRGWEWVNMNIIKPLTQKMTNPKFLENIFVSVEKGGISVTYKNDTWVQEIKAGAPLPNDFIQAADALTNSHTDTQSRKETKQTMYSSEMHALAPDSSPAAKDKKLREFQEQRDQLKKQFEQLTDEYGLADTYEVDPTTIALDIQPRGVGKRLGTREALRWLKEKAIHANLYEVFGDSTSDVDMALQLYDYALPVKLIFVGDESKLEGIEMPFEKEVRSKTYDQGTIEYLQTSSHQ